MAVPSLRSIARTCGVAPSAVYWHFPSEADLRSAVLDAEYANQPTNTRMAPACPMAEFPFQVGGKRTGMVVVSLLDGPQRFSRLRQALTPVTAKVLTQTLRDMHRDGLITRQDYDTNPPHVEYELTELGRSLMPVVDTMREWSRRHLAVLLAHREQHATH